MKRDNLVGTRGALRSADSTCNGRYEDLVFQEFALSLSAVTATPPGLWRRRRKQEPFTGRITDMEFSGGRAGRRPDLTSAETTC